MRKSQTITRNGKQIKREQLIRLAIPLLLLASPFRIPKTAYYQREDHLNLILHASLDQAYLEQIGRVDGKMIADTAFGQLYQFEKWEIVQACNQMFQKQIQQTRLRRRRKAYALAVDWTDIPYYGKATHLWIVKGKAKRGTCYFHRYLTISIVVAKYRFILGMHPMKRTEMKATRRVKVLNRLLMQARRVAPFQTVYFDRGFFATPILRYLDELRPRLTYIMAVPRNQKIKRLITRIEAHYETTGRFPSQVEQIRVTRRRKHCHPSPLGYRLSAYLLGKTQYPINLQIWKDWSTTKRGQKYLRDFVYCSNSDLAPPQLHQGYKARFGIETSYRELGMMRAKTRSNAPQVRFFFFGIACLLYNAWVVSNLHLLEGETPLPKEVPPLDPTHTVRPYAPPLPLFDFKSLLADRYFQLDFFGRRKKGPPRWKKDQRLHKR